LGVRLSGNPLAQFKVGSDFEGELTARTEGKHEHEESLKGVCSQCAGLSELFAHVQQVQGDLKQPADAAQRLASPSQRETLADRELVPQQA